MGEFPSGQRGQTVNLLLLASVVRIHLLPPEKNSHLSKTDVGSFQLSVPYGTISTPSVREVCFAIKVPVGGTLNFTLCKAQYFTMPQA